MARSHHAKPIRIRPISRAETPPDDKRRLCAQEAFEICFDVILCAWRGGECAVNFAIFVCIPQGEGLSHHGIAALCS